MLTIFIFAYTDHMSEAQNFKMPQQSPGFHQISTNHYGKYGNHVAVQDIPFLTTLTSIKTIMYWGVKVEFNAYVF